MKHHHDTTELRPSLSEIGGWFHQLQQWQDRLAPHFARSETRHHALHYIQAILSDIPRKNCWQIAEQARQAQPNNMQHFLSRAVWNCEGVRDELRAKVLLHLGANPSATMVLDESGFPKRGKKSAGVKKQYCGTTGRVENCQVGVFLSYVTARGHALIDRDLYLPEDWLADQQRCREAGIPQQSTFRPKWEIALHMRQRARAASVPFAWVVADTVYGQAVELRHWLEQLGYAYGLAISSDETVCVQRGDNYLLALARDVEATLMQPENWQQLAMSFGTKGPRLFAWAILPQMHQGTVDGRHWLVIRRCIDDPGQKTYYLIYAPEGTTLQEMVFAIGNRWHREEDIQATKNLGLDQYEVRSYTGWYRHYSE